MNAFEKLRSGQHCHVFDDADYVRDAHGEFDRCRQLCWLINQTDPNDTKKIRELERELFNGNFDDTNFLIPPFQIDAGCRIFLGKNILANHGLTVMSVGTITIEDGVMLGPEVALLTVNHEPKNIRVIYTKEIHIKRNADWRTSQHFARRDDWRKRDCRHRLNRHEGHSRQRRRRRQPCAGHQIHRLKNRRVPFLKKLWQRDAVCDILPARFSQGSNFFDSRQTKAAAFVPRDI